MCEGISGVCEGKVHVMMACDLHTFPMLRGHKHAAVLLGILLSFL